MSVLDWLAATPSVDGSREALYEAFRRESDEGRRATALRALVALEVGSRRSGSDSARLLALLESCAADEKEPLAIRKAAITALPFVSIGRARAIIPGLLESSSCLRNTAIDVLEAVSFLEKALTLGASIPAAAELRRNLRNYVAEVIDGPETPPEDRARGLALLTLFSH
jgi:hypothetical protein